MKKNKENRRNTLRTQIAKLRQRYTKLTKDLTETLCKGIGHPMVDALIQKRNALSVKISQAEKKIINLENGHGELGQTIGTFDNSGVSEFD